MKKAMITGASSGLGREYAFLLASQGYELILVARNEKKLLEVKNKVSTPVKIEVMDLGITRNLTILCRKYKNSGLSLLINNAGIGNFGFFNETNLELDKKVINLNITALTVLAKKFYKVFLDQNYGRIINIGSIAGFFPGPLFSTYHASKAYVNSFSVALWHESKHIKKSLTRVVLIAPGPIKTNFNITAKQAKPHGQNLSSYARKSLKKAMRTNCHTVIVGRDFFAYFIVKFLFSARLLARLAACVQKKYLS